jgi:hypothetical protein
MAQADDGRASLSELWASRLHAATTPDEIVCVANDFVASWTEGDRARMPSQCLPPRLGTPQDVSAYAFALTQARLDFVGAATRTELLENMCGFMSAAAMRIAQLAHLSRAHI